MSLPTHRLSLAILAVLFSASTATTQTAPASSSASPHNAVSKPAVRKPRHSRKSKKNEGPHKVVVRQGGTTETLPQMAPVAPRRQESSERIKSGQLLTATEANLKELGDKNLSAEQQATIRQIRQFMDQSRAVLDAGDITQGYNLASKANVLSEELKKH